MENLTNHLKNRFKRLEKRAQWLRIRILEHTHEHNSMEYDRMELSALEWSMRVILKYYSEHPKEEDFEKPYII